MSVFTTIWNLLKKNPATDGNDTFNIQTMLNDNWDKLDAALGMKAVNADVRAATVVNIGLNGLQTIDGVTLAEGDRVLVKNQTTGSQNGLYTAASGEWTRTVDADSDAKLASGFFVNVKEGTANAGTGWMMSNAGSVTLGTTALLFTQKTGAGSASDSVIGTRTIDDSIAAASDSDTPTRLWSKLAYMVRSITGKSNWYTPPSTTIEALSANKLDASSYTAADVLSKVKTVDGAGSGLDADTVDGHQTSSTAVAGAIPVYNESAQLVGDMSGNAATATRLATERTFSFTGDATGSAGFDGSANLSMPVTLSSSGVSAGTYRSVKVDSKGRVTAGSNPSTLGGYGITDAAPLSHVSDYTSHVPYVAAGGSANAYTANLSPSPSSLATGLALAVKVNIANTGASTINVNGFGAKSILTGKGGALPSGKLVANGIYTLRYNGTAFILQGEGGDYGTAGASQVLTGYTVGTETGLVAGTMPNNGSLSYTPGASAHSIPSGYTSGGTVAAVANLTAANIKAGATVGGVAGTFTSDATAAASNILTGKIAYVNGSKVTGTMADNGAVTFTPSASAQTIPAGYHSGSGKVNAVTFDSTKVLTGTTIAGTAGKMPNNGSLGTITPGTSAKTIPAGYTSGGTVAGDADLVAANILSGKNIFGVAGSSTVVDTATGTAIAGDILSGKVAYSDGVKLTGTMQNNGAGGTVSPGRSGQTKPAGYYSSPITIAGDNDLVAGNIRNGINIFGVTGTFKSQSSSGTAIMSSDYMDFVDDSGGTLSLRHLTVSGIGFSPKVFIARNYDGANGANVIMVNHTNFSTSGTRVLLTYFHEMGTSTSGVLFKITGNLHVGSDYVRVPMVDMAINTFSWWAFGDVI